MLREIKFVVTGEIRKPKSGDWFLNTKNFPICAAQDFDISKYPILKMEIVEEEEAQTPSKHSHVPFVLRK
ncbi:MAG TPA: hypothetical protein VHO84_01215 [Syntrophorhabdaceae bacterium]|nr:hypothetical protein [Syntrophorhabdaceae bacterium]